MVHDGDGGRYLSTWHMIVAEDPDTKDVNWGMYRQMVFDEKTMVGPVLPFSDMGKMFWGKSVPRNQPLPFATVIDMDPLAGIAACAPSSIPEDHFCGQLMGEAVELVKCETNDLMVPAHAEIIIEGEILPGINMYEAPFGEYTGYRTSPREERTVYRVKAITHRNKPIVSVSNMGVPTDEGQLLRSFSLGLEMDKLLRSQGIPITGVYMLPESTHHLVVIGVRPAYAGIAQQCAQLVFGSKLGPWFHQVIVVDDKTDIYNVNEVIHAFSTRCDPARDIHIYENSAGTPLNPYSLAGRPAGRPRLEGRLRLPVAAGVDARRDAHHRLVRLGLPAGRQGQGAGQLDQLRVQGVSHVTEYDTFFDTELSGVAAGRRVRGGHPRPDPGPGQVPLQVRPGQDVGGPRQVRRPAVAAAGPRPVDRRALVGRGRLAGSRRSRPSGAEAPRSDGDEGRRPWRSLTCVRRSPRCASRGGSSRWASRSSARHEVAAFLAVAGRERPATAYVFTNVTSDATPVGPIGDAAAPALPVVANVIHSRDVLALGDGRAARRTRPGLRGRASARRCRPG